MLIAAHAGDASVKRINHVTSSKITIGKRGITPKLLHWSSNKSAHRHKLLPLSVFPFDQAWAPSAASIAPQLFAVSLFPYIGFLYHLTKSGQTPKLTLIGFYFLLVFVAVTIPAGIYAKTQYGTSLANVDWLHGGAESLLTVTNLLIVLGLRKGIREVQKQGPDQKDMQE
ncbi:hypothetical protein CEUSTIGMA_g12004.t1 [Chlamydomonas eustigma]|uniref:DUF3593 domain-containing protein n=1 Tax=Chlamydomonas eustigma TaxID=1157962 RepID=A0A250XNL7_9CHLO|nr:hypothetical protein CEUSTIGMA_g12004.t1 [Chlamydomonas eustigma]|eukprot:GAX84583.1 hypothetical protein CEUSTIGMA_g12004.t1 [Chlamydomonas eustigma]